MKIITVLSVLFCALTPVSAAAGLADSINELRSEGCRGRTGTPVRLQPDRELDAVAREWSRGGRLSDALVRARYRAVSSASMHIQGAADEKALLRALADNYCQTLVDPKFTAIGISQHSAAVHIVVALPFSAPSASDAKTVRERVLLLVNQARAQARSCGGSRFAAVPALTLSAPLTGAALSHARDMASRNFFEHQGSDGSTVAVRAARAGYEWRSIGENIAAGPDDCRQCRQRLAGKPRALRQHHGTAVH